MCNQKNMMMKDKQMKKLYNLKMRRVILIFNVLKFEINGALAVQKGIHLQSIKSCNVEYKDKFDYQNESCEISYYEFLKLDQRKTTSVFRQTQESVSYSLKGEMNSLIYYKQFDDECKYIVKEIVDNLIELNCNIYLEQRQFDEIANITHSNRLYVFTKEQITLISLIIVVGGDGTVLYALRQFQSQEPPPILAFQKGTLGFMCVFDLKDKYQVLSKQIEHFRTAGQFIVERKLRLKGCLIQSGGQKFEYHVLNEFVITRGANPHCLYIEIYINDVLLTLASGDGIIVSTPTGSTAYFLSAGGPIIQNEVPSISIAPICPLSLSFRPIVLPTCLNITIKLANQCRANGFICADGQTTVEFNKDMIFQILKSEKFVSIIQDKSDIDYNEWVHNLRKKLGWNKVFTDQKKYKSNL
ncbi:unnamed protein product [Paramecium sonneborni]|uniref:NAD(+) kinase n=1 Tax=Paramecium sonneborni TaxID=65129 RepID=A0A8S1N969_9CILI|nr:unnamed protein product [Paramecium sonneborni]